MTRDKAIEVANTLHLLENMEHIEESFNQQLYLLDKCGVSCEAEFINDLYILFDKYKNKYEQALNEVE